MCRSLLANRKAIPRPGIKVVRIFRLSAKRVTPALSEFLLINQLVPLLTGSCIRSTGDAFEMNHHRKRLIIDLESSFANSEAVIGFFIVNGPVSKIQTTELFK